MLDWWIVFSRLRKRWVESLFTIFPTGFPSWMRCAVWNVGSNVKLDIWVLGRSNRILQPQIRGFREGISRNSTNLHRKYPLTSSPSRRLTRILNHLYSYNKLHISQKGSTWDGMGKERYWNTYTWVHSDSSFCRIMIVRTRHQPSWGSWRLSSVQFRLFILDSDLCTLLLLTRQTIYLPPPSLRRIAFSVPPQDAVDYRAVCFCHGDAVDIGFVCSVCLSSKF
jgi:hypothetical protein